MYTVWENKIIETAGIYKSNQMVLRHYVCIIKHNLSEWLLHNAGKWNLSKIAGNSNTATAL